MVFGDPDVERWFARRTYAREQRSIEDLVAAKRSAEATISVCLPALDEAATIGPICDVIRTELLGPGVVDELIVVDSGSSDGTTELARAAGARVETAAALVPEAGTPTSGKGESLWKSLSVVTGDIVVWLDSDTRNFSPTFVTSLVGPLLDDRDVGFVKAFYERPLQATAETLPTGGARVTEIAIRPLVNLFYPSLAAVIQPLSGEYAARTRMLRTLPFATGYAVDIRLLIDVVERWGLDALAQADLGSRIHRNRPIPELGRMSFEIMHALFERLDDEGRVKLSETLPQGLVQFTGDTGLPRPVAFEQRAAMRPPMEAFL